MAAAERESGVANEITEATIAAEFGAVGAACDAVAKASVTAASGGGGTKCRPIWSGSKGDNRGNCNRQ